MGRFLENTLILTVEPFVGFMPADLRAWLKENNADADLAAALAAVHNHIGTLGYELNEVDDPWLFYAFDAWYEIEAELYELIFKSMKQSNLRGETNYSFSQQGHYRLVPFMERNGFRSGSGWWVKSDARWRKRKSSIGGYG